MRRALDDANHPALLMVDGVSSIGSIEFDQDAWGVDCAVSGSQKGFMLPAGLGILSVSKWALDAHKRAEYSRTFFSFEDMIATNDVSGTNVGFNSDNNALTVIWPGGHKVLPLASKAQIAKQLIELIAIRYKD